MTLFDAHGRPIKKAKREKTIPVGEPIIETTHAENLAARRFLGFLLADINYQTRAVTELHITHITFAIPNITKRS